jgi:hypothetical protein
VIEYYDSRDCEAAYDGVSENPNFMDGQLDVEFAWDEFERLIERERSDYRGGNCMIFQYLDRRESSRASESDLNALLVSSWQTKISKIEYSL